MKQLFVLMACGLALAACSSRNKPMPVWQPVSSMPAAKQDAAPIVDANGAEVQRIPFRAGVSSVTVEQLAKTQGCVSDVGAGLTTPQGPSEAYRIVCEDRRVLTATCEFRQCKLNK